MSSVPLSQCLICVCTCMCVSLCACVHSCVLTCVCMGGVCMRLREHVVKVGKSLVSHPEVYEAILNWRWFIKACIVQYFNYTIHVLLALYTIVV